jgi:hypothetical protein
MRRNDVVQVKEIITHRWLPLPLPPGPVATQLKKKGNWLLANLLKPAE